MIRVLFLAANPSNLPKLKLEDEVQAILEKMGPIADPELNSDLREQIEFVPHLATKPDDLIELLNRDDNWDVIHFSGHGSVDNEIVLQDEKGELRRVGKEALANVFKILGGRVRLVVLNACYAAPQAQALVEHVDCAVGMSGAMGDREAVLFAGSFYRAIASGRSIGAAFDQGVLAIQVADGTGADQPRLEARRGTDPHTIQLTSRSSRYGVEDAWTLLAPPPPALDERHDWHTFLSYRSVNRTWVLNLYDVLDRQGYRVFLDAYVLSPGKSLVSELEKSLMRSRTGILIWSSANEDSPWCRHEYESMVQREMDDPGFRFIVLKLGPGELPAFARRKRWIDFADYPDGPTGIGLLELLGALSGEQPRPDAVRFAAEHEDAVRQAMLNIRASVDAGLAPRLVQLFEAGGLAWKTSAMLGSAVAEGLIRLGSYDDAISILDKLTAKFSRSVRPRQLKALALARRGAPGDLDEAQTLLGVLRAEGHRDPETLGIYARTWMDRYAASGERPFLRNSRDLYAEAFDASPGDFYTGINAATKSVFLGEFDKAEHYASRVAEILKNAPDPSDYWGTATRAEALLIQKDYAGAASLYEKAVARSPTETGSHDSSRGQAIKLLDALGAESGDREKVIAAFGNA